MHAKKKDISPASHRPLEQRGQGPDCADARGGSNEAPLLVMRLDLGFCKWGLMGIYVTCLAARLQADHVLADPKALLVPEGKPACTNAIRHVHDLSLWLQNRQSLLVSMAGPARISCSPAELGGGEAGPFLGMRRLALRRVVELQAASKPF